MFALQQRLAPLVRRSTSVRAYSGLQYHVQRGAIVAPESPIHPRQQVECTWTIRSRESYDHRDRHRARGSRTPHLERLKIQTPGLTLVRFRPELLDSVGSDLVAQVRVSSDTARTLQAVSVTPRWPNRTVIDFEPSSSCGVDLRGHLLTEIEVPHAGWLRNLAAMGYGDVVVGEDLLVNGDRAAKLDERDPPRRGRGRRARHHRYDGVQLLATNQSRLFVDAPSKHFQLDHLRLASLGSASEIQVDVGGLDIARSLDVGVIGADATRVDLFTDTLVTSRVKLSTIGEGSAEVSTRKYLDTQEVHDTAIGDGYIRMTAGDKCETICRNQRVTTVGTSTTDFTSIPTSDASVKAVGGGDVLVKARGSLRVRSVGTTTVECAERLPQRLNVRGFPSPRLVETSTKHTNDPSDLHSKATVPSIEDAFSRDYTLKAPYSRTGFWSRFRRHADSPFEK